MPGTPTDAVKASKKGGVLGRSLPHYSDSEKFRDDSKN